MRPLSPPGADPYVPGHGDTSYSVEHYDLALTYKPAGNHITGRAVVELVVKERADRLRLDLHALRVTKVTVAGAPLAHWDHQRGRLLLELATVIAAGTRITVTVGYQGNPKPVPGPDGGAGWEELEDGVIVASQPYGAPSWFPCNDRPSDKATYRIAVTTASGYAVVANGRLMEKRTASSRTTWVYDVPEPMATYLATVQIGRYLSHPVTGSSVPITVLHPPGLTAAVDAAFARQGEMLEAFARLYGPYPFSAYTVVVTADDLEIPLESQTLSTFGANHVRTDWGAQRLIAHELSHQWFGNSLTASHWRDIWLHEGFACYSEWLWSQESGGTATAQHAAIHWSRLDKLPQDLVLSDPGATDLFDDRVYKRGALTLHALRVTVGDVAFFALLRAWVAERRHGSVTTDHFVEAANRHHDGDLTELFRRWLHEPALPQLPGLSRLPGLPARPPGGADGPTRARRTRHTQW